MEIQNCSSTKHKKKMHAKYTKYRSRQYRNTSGDLEAGSNISVGLNVLFFNKNQFLNNTNLSVCATDWILPKRYSY